MRIVTLEVLSREKSKKRTLQDFRWEKAGTFISFESPDLLFKVLLGKCWELLRP